MTFFWNNLRKCLSHLKKGKKKKEKEKEKENVYFLKLDFRKMPG